MQVALTIWEGRISPLFDATRTLLIAQVVKGRVISRRIVPFDCESAFLRAAHLHDLGVELLICGGISDIFASLIEAQGIEIIPFAAGAVDEILEAYLAAEQSGRYHDAHAMLSTSDQVARPVDRYVSERLDEAPGTASPSRISVEI